MRPSSSPNTSATAARAGCTPWVESHSVSGDRVVVVHRGGVGAVEGDRGGGHRGLDVALAGVGLVRGVDRVGLVQVVAVGAQLRVVRLLVVADRHQVGGLPGELGGLGDDHADRLAAEGDLVALQHGQLGVLGGGQPLGVAGGQHGQDAVERAGLRGVDGGDPPAGDRRLHDLRVGRRRHRRLVGVGGGAAHLVRAVAAGQALPDRARFEQAGHAAASVSSRRVATSVRVTRGILKPLPPSRPDCGWAAASSASAAAR